MDAQTAVHLINSLVYKPDWEFLAEENGRFQDGVCVHVTYAARRSERDQAPAYGEWIPGGALVSFTLQVTDCVTRPDVCRMLIEQVIMPIELHEAREFLRYPDSLVAPFHPHRAAGMVAWGTPERDLVFGIG